MPSEMTITVAPPRNRKNANSPMVAKDPRLARKLMPFSTPDVAGTRNRAVTITMMITATELDFGTSSR